MLRCSTVALAPSTRRNEVGLKAWRTTTSQIRRAIPGGILVEPGHLVVLVDLHDNPAGEMPPGGALALLEDRDVPDFPLLQQPLVRLHLQKGV